MSDTSLPYGRPTERRNWWERRVWTIVFAVAGVIAACLMLLMANQMFPDAE
jgi:hypothetical protein